MAQTTEAACLLESGALYSRRVGWRTSQGGDVFAGVKPGAVSIYFGDAPIYHFDLDGRWQRAFVDSLHLLKGRDASVQTMAREREAGEMLLRRQTLRYAEVADLDDSVRSIAMGLIEDLDSDRVQPLVTRPGVRPFALEELREFLERVVSWDSAAWFAHRERFLGTYGPFPFLPPDALNALVLQATLGNAGGRAFGGARPAEHYRRSLGEFRDHAQAVAQLTGRRLAQYRGIFLAGADVWHLPVVELLAILGVIRETFPLGLQRPSEGDRWDDQATRLGQVSGFLDDLAAPLPDPAGWRMLREAGLSRMTLGVESGVRAIRAAFGKTWEADSLRSTVADLQEASIGVGLVVLVGVGGAEMADRHVEATSELVASLPLTSSDLVTLVDARSFDHDFATHLDQLTDEAIAAQVAGFKSRSLARASKGPRLVVYNPDKQRT